MKEIGSGAEATIYKKDSTVIKIRPKKPYRHEHIDLQLRQTRTRAESKILHKLNNIAPKLISTNKEDEIVMEYIKGTKVRDLIDNNIQLAELIGKNLTQMHDKGIIHGDLTTSNMIYDEEINKLTFIDFGLSYFSKKIEDMAVDVHLFKQALESKHYKIFEKAYSEFLKNYNPKNKKEILQRLIAVEKRGKYKQK